MADEEGSEIQPSGVPDPEAADVASSEGRCPNGHQVPDGSKFCAACGAAVAPSSPAVPFAPARRFPRWAPFAALAAVAALAALAFLLTRPSEESEEVTAGTDAQGLDLSLKASARAKSACWLTR
jgi:hypothetical protein